MKPLSCCNCNETKPLVAALSLTRTWSWCSVHSQIDGHNDRSVQNRLTALRSQASKVFSPDIVQQLLPKSKMMNGVDAAAATRSKLAVLAHKQSRSDVLAIAIGCWTSAAEQDAAIDQVAVVRPACRSAVVVDTDLSLEIVGQLRTLKQANDSRAWTLEQDVEPHREASSTLADQAAA